MQMMLSMEGMDMDLGAANFVWSILAPMVLVKLVQLEEDLKEDLDPQVEDLNSGSW